MNYHFLGSRFCCASLIILSICILQVFFPTNALAVNFEQPNSARNDYVPRAGYKRTVDILALRRKIKPSIQRRAPGTVTALSGNRAVPTILLEFKNKPAKFPSNNYVHQLFGDPLNQSLQPTFSQYYSDMSLGRFEVAGTVLGWYSLPKKDVYYEGSGNGDGAPFGEFLKFGLTEADKNTDFGQYDNDGPDGQPNSGDDDGVVDAVFFVHSEAGAECSSAATTRNIWSHSWHYSETSYGNTSPFQTDDVMLDHDQLPTLNGDGSNRMILIEDYTIQPGLSCPKTSKKDTIVPIGVFTHEYGHALGLPDLYDRTPRNNADSNGIGNWGLMSGGSWGFNKKNPALPTRLSAWSLARLGWAKLQPIDTAAATPIKLEPVQENNLIHVVDFPKSSNTEFYLIELKDPTWSDKDGKRINWDLELPTVGLAIWHVDEKVGAHTNTWPFAPHDEGQNDSASLPGKPKHSLVSLEQADCEFNLENANNPGDYQDLWETEKDVQLNGCKHLASTYTGIPTDLKIDSIDINKREVRLKNPVVAQRPKLAPIASMAQTNEYTDGLNVFTPIVAIKEVPPVFKKVNSLLFADNTKSKKLTSVLTSGEQNALLTAQRYQLEAGIDREYQKDIKSWVAEMQTVNIEEPLPTNSNFDKKLNDIRQLNKKSISVHKSPTSQQVKQVKNLQLEVVHPTLSADSNAKLDTIFLATLAENTDLELKPGIMPEAMHQAYQQMLTLNKSRVPIFSKGVSLHYLNGAELTAFTNSTVDVRNIEVVGDPGEMSIDTALGIAISELGLSEGASNRLEDKGEGIYLINDDPSQAKVVRKLSLPVSAYQEDILIFVDQSDGSIISIE